MVENQVSLPTEQDVLTLEMLSKAWVWAMEKEVPLIIASTTGATAECLARCHENKTGRVFIVTHNQRRVSETDKFNPLIFEKIQDFEYVFLEDKYSLWPLSLVRYLHKFFGLTPWDKKERILEEILGTGGRVCFQITERVMRKGYLKPGDTVVAAAGCRSGVNTVLALKIRKHKPHAIALQEIIACERGCKKKS